MLTSRFSSVDSTRFQENLVADTPHFRKVFISSRNSVSRGVFFSWMTGERAHVMAGFSVIYSETVPCVPFHDQMWKISRGWRSVKRGNDVWVLPCCMCGEVGFWDLPRTGWRRWIGSLRSIFFFPLALCGNGVSHSDFLRLFRHSLAGFLLSACSLFPQGWIAFLQDLQLCSGKNSFWWLIDWLIGVFSCFQSCRRGISRLIDWLSSWLAVDWLVDWLIDQVKDCSTDWSNFHRLHLPVQVYWYSFFISLIWSRPVVLVILWSYKAIAWLLDWVHNIPTMQVAWLVLSGLTDWLIGWLGAFISCHFFPLSLPKPYNPGFSPFRKRRTIKAKNNQWSGLNNMALSQKFFFLSFIQSLAFCPPLNHGATWGDQCLYAITSSYVSTVRGLNKWFRPPLPRSVWPPYRVLFDFVLTWHHIFIGRSTAVYRGREKRDHLCTGV